MWYLLAFLCGWVVSLLSVFVVAYLTKPINAGRGEVHTPKKLVPKPQTFEV